MSDETEANPHLHDEIAPAEAPISPATRAAFEALQDVEKRQDEILRRAELARQARDLLADELREAEAAAQAAEAAAIVERGDDAEAAATAARGRLEDLRESHTKQARAAEVLAAEADKLTAAIEEQCGTVFRAACADLEALAADVTSELESRLADLVPALKRQALVAATLGRLEGGLPGANSLAVTRVVEPVRNLLKVAGHAPESWQEADDDVESLRAIAAGAAPNPGHVPQDWVDEERRDRKRARMEAERGRQERELEERRAAVRARPRTLEGEPPAAA